MSVAPDPDACRWEWERSPTGVALLPAGRRWDVLIIPGRLGYPTLDVLQRLVGRPGPVLADFGDARMGFFVPPAPRPLGGYGVRTAGRGTWIVVPYPGRTTGGVRWLVLPDGAGTLTDPVLLELALHEAAGSLAGHTRSAEGGTAARAPGHRARNGPAAPGTRGRGAPRARGRRSHRRDDPCRRPRAGRTRGGREAPCASTPKTARAAPFEAAGTHTATAGRGTAVGTGGRGERRGRIPTAEAARRQQSAPEA